MSEKEKCYVEPVAKPLDREALSSARAAYLAVSGMGCPNCAARVRNGLLSLEGVLLAEIQLEQGVAATAYDPQRVTVEDLIHAVSQSGNDGRHHYFARLLEEMPAEKALRL
jgi:copper chaperone CopZ